MLEDDFEFQSLSEVCIEVKDLYLFPRSFFENRTPKIYNDEFSNSSKDESGFPYNLLDKIKSIFYRSS